MFENCESTPCFSGTLASAPVCREQKQSSSRPLHLGLLHALLPASVPSAAPQEARSCFLVQLCEFGAHLQLGALCDPDRAPPCLSEQ